MESWKCKWGTFTFKHGWSTTLKIPAFDAFSYETGRKRPNPNGTYKISLEAKDDRDVPSDEMMHILNQLLDNAKPMVNTIASALWEDFNGYGPNSRMWWHKGLKQVNEAVAEEADGMILKKADDLLKVIYLQGITILKEQRAQKGRPIVNPMNGEVIKTVDVPYQPVVATMHFCAAFEREHGLDILTDGMSILGMGYALEAEMYPAK